VGSAEGSSVGDAVGAQSSFDGQLGVPNTPWQHSSTES